MPTTTPAGRKPGSHVRYRRSRFSTALPAPYLYTPAHCWLAPDESGRCRVGFTKFATRMLGDVVDLDFEAARGAEIAAGAIVGWIEGFKATSDLYAPIDGRFAGANADLDDDATLISRDPYGRGWLFLVEGTPGAGCLDVHGYARTLDATIDRMLGKEAPSS